MRANEIGMHPSNSLSIETFTLLTQLGPCAVRIETQYTIDKPTERLL